MHVSVERRPDQSVLGREEGFLHFIAREGRTVLRWVIGISMIAIVVCMVSPGFFFLAVVPALALLGAYVMLILTNEVERRSDVEAHEILARSETATAADVIENHADDDQLEPMSAEIIKRESRTGVAIVAAVMIAAVLVAGILFNWQVVAIGALVVFAYMLLVAAPLWLGWFNDDIEITSHRMVDMQEPAGVKTGEAE